MPEVVQQDKNFDYEQVTYDNEIDMQSDINLRESEGWQVMSAQQTSGGMSGGCVGCIGFFPIFIPLGNRRKRYTVIYRRGK